MQCPVCPESQLAISSREGVEIDYCAQCRGVWLDRGELDKILERAGPQLGRPEEPRYAPPRDDVRSRDDDDDRYRGGVKRRRKRSFLDDIFDFD